MSENTENDTAFGKIFARAWRDPDFKVALIANPAVALEAEGVEVPPGTTVTVLENTDHIFHFVLPNKPAGEFSGERLESAAMLAIDLYNWRRRGLLSHKDSVFMSENELEIARIIAKAWRDPAFKAALLAAPTSVLEAEGMDVPAGGTVTVVENTDNHFHLVLPAVIIDELTRVIHDASS
jgi:hypothetical protein